MSKIFAADGRSVTLALDGFGFSAKTAGGDPAPRTVPPPAVIWAASSMNSGLFQ